MNRNISDLKQEIDLKGYVYLQRFMPELSTFQLASRLGEVIAIPGMPTVQRITPKGQENAPINVYSGNFGLKEFPLHTDLAHWYVPPRYFVLRCIEPASSVFTVIIDISLALRGLPEGTVRRALCVPRRNLDGKKHLLRLLQQNGSLFLYRWDRIFILPANREAQDVGEHIRKISPEDANTWVAFISPADTLIVDNWRMLHGRSAVPDQGLQRVIERAYLAEVN